MADYNGKRAGNYTIVQKLGDGGFATVYLAQHTVLEKKAAVKFLLEEWINEPDVVSRFFDEARTMERLKESPNIVEIIDIASKEICEREGLPPYFIMEYIDGKSLEAKIHSDDGFTLEFIVEVISTALKALAHCHAKGVIHRDIKPSNILLTSDGRVKLTDFGIAKAKLNTSKTGSGLTLGSTDYMSPEQALGKRDMDHRSDIYSIGVTLYEMVVGTLPFISDNPNSVALMHIQEPPKAPIEVNPACPPRLNNIILKAMEKKREDRFQTCEEMIEALKRMDEPEEPVTADVETVDLSTMKSELPEDDLKEKTEGADGAEVSTKAKTKVTQALASQPVRNSMFMVALVVLFTISFLGVFKGYMMYTQGILLIDSAPSGATVLVDGKQVGSSPVSLTLSPGTYKVGYALPGYHPLTVRADLQARATINLRRELRKIVQDLDKKAAAAFEELPAAGSVDPKKAKQVAHQQDVLQSITRFLDQWKQEPDVHLAWERRAGEKGYLAYAEQYYQARSNQNAGNVLFMTMLGRIQMARGNMKESLDTLTKAWYIDQNDILMLNSLGDYFRKENNREKAKQYYELSLFLDPGQTAILQILKQM
ncbi:protein kinase [Candidatus Ozemobacteraceae bacterium]|nr:protein kinase [Candidatus Ozemobacteraceae bacterium]